MSDSGTCEVCGEFVENLWFTAMVGDGPTVDHCGQPYCCRVAFNRVNGYPDNHQVPRASEKEST